MSAGEPKGFISRVIGVEVAIEFSERLACIVIKLGERESTNA